MNDKFTSNNQPTSSTYLASLLSISMSISIICIYASKFIHLFNPIFLSKLRHKKKKKLLVITNPDQSTCT